MMVRVLIFGPLSRTMGTRAIAVETAEPTTVADVNEALARTQPERAEFFRTARLAVNGAFAARTHPIESVDEVALIEMVSGG